MDLLSIYHHEIPEFLLEFANTKPMLRLQDVGMHCGCEYTSFPIFRNLNKYSRYEHSVGVALIIYHFTKDIKQSLAGLFHDIATPTFSHVIDFVNNDHLTQESTENGTKEIIAQAQVIQQLLQKYQLTTEDVCDYHQYPIADNDTPQLSADRLEYTLHNMINFQYTDMQTIKKIYQDLHVSTNEQKEIELQFQHLNQAKYFALGSLYCSLVYVCDADRFAMQYLAYLIKDAIDQQVLSLSDLYKTETHVIQKLNASSLRDAWTTFQKLSITEASTDPISFHSYIIPAKKRYINPYITNQGRLTQLDSFYQQELQYFLDTSLDYWVTGR